MKVIHLKTYRVFKERRRQEAQYRQSLLVMDKAKLLEEFLRYHEAYQRDPHDVNVTIRGQHLLEILEQRAELRELQELSRELRAKLNARLYKQLQGLSSSN